MLSRIVDIRLLFKRSRVLVTGKDLLDRHDETIAAGGHGKNVLGLKFAIAQSFSKDRNTLNQICLLNDAVRPDRVHQLILGNQSATGFEKEEQKLMNARSKRYDSSIRPDQTALPFRVRKLTEYESIHLIT
jgi:hypothetical protein